MPVFSDLRRRNLEALFDLAGVGLFSTDLDGRVRSMNREAERALRLRPGQAIGLACREMLGAHMCSEDCALKLTRKDGEPRREHLLRVVETDGTQRDLLFSTAFLDAPDPEHREVAVAVRDVTEAERLRRALRDRWTFHGMVAASPRMKEVFALVTEMAPYDSTVLLLGESGTGKELVARAIHGESRRRTAPFVTVNCSAYSEGVLESELFGHVEGAFTGAVRSRVGRFEAASGGTVFLDEVGEIPPSIQVKLLRVLQERVLERVGDMRPVPVDLRVVAATNRDLRKAVAEGRFREDLYYRLKVIAIELPPLRDRREDIPALAEHFLGGLREATGKDVTAFSPEAMDLLFRHAWPGNVRELRNAVEHAVVKASGTVAVPADLPPEVGRGPAGPPRDSDRRRAAIDAALRSAGGNLSRAAALLGVHRTTLWRWLRG
ncbi:MAG: sigma 54-interacting transcriptional regulator [Planctomycetes bacterium]|nr:sigma 54-interacting transcriptional regulator [Planctomycetota bacterium]